MTPAIRVAIALAGLALLSAAQGQEEVAVHHETRAEDGIAETIRTRDLLIKGEGWVEPGNRS